MSTTCSLTKVDTNHLMWGKGIGNKEELGSLKIIFVARCNACFRSILSKTQTTYQTALQWLPFCFQAVNHIRNTVESKSLQMKGWILYSFKLELKKNTKHKALCALCFFNLNLFCFYAPEEYVNVFCQCVLSSPFVWLWRQTWNLCDPRHCITAAFSWQSRLRQL